MAERIINRLYIKVKDGTFSRKEAMERLERARYYLKNFEQDKTIFINMLDLLEKENKNESV